LFACFYLGKLFVFLVVQSVGRLYIFYVFKYLANVGVQGLYLLGNMGKRLCRTGRRNTQLEVLGNPCCN
jgi:hypothetical protein